MQIPKVTMQHTKEVGKKSLAFDIRHDFKQISKPFDAYDDVLVFIHSHESLNVHIRSEQNPYEIKYV